ncbi:otubain [Trifolium medium]|uniref:Otubain n=1 Tax=Trifolium medium TaxID=97028 RepID=A0A392QFD4_9FABA|nr:otubain [Trifolium medium]
MALMRILAEVRRAKDVGLDKSKYGCISRTTFGLPCACELSNVVMERNPISLDIIHSHWKRLSLEDADLIQEGRPSLSLLPEWEVIQARFNNADYSMQVELKEKFRQFAYPETTSMQSPPKKVSTKGAKKKTRYSQA